jgi:hypothetical protein
MNGRIESRYEIGCRYCGLIDYRKTKSEAFNVAFSVADDHKTKPIELITVFDSMARIGDPELYGLCGGQMQILERRRKKGAPNDHQHTR